MPESIDYIKLDQTWWENNGHGVLTYSMPDFGWNWTLNKPMTQKNKKEQMLEELCRSEDIDRWLNDFWPNYIPKSDWKY